MYIKDNFGSRNLVENKSLNPGCIHLKTNRLSISLVNLVIEIHMISDL